MKVVIEIYQSTFNSEWNCDVTTVSDGGNSETEYWKTSDFCALLYLVGKEFVKAKCIAQDASRSN